MAYNFMLFITVVTLCFDICVQSAASNGTSTSSSKKQPETQLTGTSEVSSTAKPNKKSASQSVETDIVEFPIKPGPKPDIPEDTFVILDDDNNTCILIKLSVQIFLEKTEFQPSKNLPLPDDLKASGTCDSKNSSEVALMFESYELHIIFNKSSDNMWWGVQSMQFTYSPTEQDKTASKTVSKSSKSQAIKNIVLRTLNVDSSMLKIPMNMSYSCKQLRKLLLYDRSGAQAASIVIDELLMQAFVPDGTFGNEFGCGDQMEEISQPTPSQPVDQVEATSKPTQAQQVAYQSDTVPIAVGSCLAVATVLVIAGYSIYRQLTVKKVEYATMDE